MAMAAGAAAVAFALMAAFALWVAHTRIDVGWFSDSVDYLVIADYYRQWFAGTPEGYSADFFGKTRFPPLFPLMLAAVGAGTVEQQLANVLTAAFMVLSAVTVFVWLVRTLRNRATAAVLLVAWTLLPGTLLLSVYPMSELPFIALLYSAMALAQVRDPVGRPRFALGVAVLIGLSALLRMVGLAAGVAFGAWLLAVDRRSLSRTVVCAFAALGPGLAWLAYRRLLPGAESYGDSLTGDKYQGEFGSWSGFLLGQPARMVSGFAENLEVWPTTPAFAVALILLAFAAIGWWRRLLDKEYDAFLLPAYVGLIFVWPFPVEIGRMLVVVVPVVLVQASVGCAWAWRRLGRPAADPLRTAAGVLALGVLAASATTLVRVGSRVLLPVAPELEARKPTRSFLIVGSTAWAVTTLELDARIAAAMRQTGNVVTPDDCVYAISPAMLWLVGNVDARPMPGRLRDDVPVREQLGDCRYFFVVYTTTIQQGQPYLYPLAHVQGWTRPVFGSFFEYSGQRNLAAGLLEVIDTPRQDDPPEANRPDP
jgi:hypothetical protein